MRRCYFMIRKFIALLLGAAAVALLFVALRQPQGTTSTLTVYCAAGLKKPIEDVTAEYQK